MKKQLLFLATMFHDIGKKETAVKNGNQTKFPGHEEYGSKKVKPILDRIDISDNEKNIVAEMIKYHGELHVIVTPNNKKLKEQYESFKHRHSTFFLELILLAMADDLGSQLKDNDPDEFNFSISFFNEIFDNYKSL